MNYFELFELPVTLRLDRARLSQKFFELSRRYHPDYFVGQGAEAEAEAMEKSSLLNRAYRVFQSPEETIKYVLQEKGLLREEEKYELPPDFLMEVLEINEQLMDADEPGTAERIRASIDQLQNEIYEPVRETVENYQEGATTAEALLRVKEYYYKKKYLDRIRRELAGKQ